MKICFCLFGRMGDVCCGIPTFQALRRIHPDAEMTWATVENHKCLIPEYAEIKIHGKAPFGSGWPGWANEQNYDLVVKAQPSWRHSQWQKSGKHAVDCIADWAGIELAKEDRCINVKIPKNDYHAAGRLSLPKGGFVTICSSPSYSSGNYWGMGLRTKIVEALKKAGYGVVSVGGHDVVTLPGTHKGYNIPIMQTVALISLSKLYIGPDTGTTWIACAARGTPKVCVINRARLKMGVVGFQKPLAGENNIVDVFNDEGAQKQIDLCLSMLKKHK